MCESHSESVRRNRLLPDTSRRLSITARDRRILVEIFLQRAVTRRQLQHLGYFGATAVANSRLRRLFDGGYVRRSFVPAGAYATEAVYVPGRDAIPELVSALGIERAEIERLIGQEAPMFLAHALAVTDARIAFTRLKPSCIAHLEWLSEPEVRHEYRLGSHAESERRVLKPDGALLVTAKTKAYLYFIEVDRGHVSCPQFAKSCASYTQYISRGIAREVYGTEHVSVLCITTGGNLRISHLAEVAKRESLALRIASMGDVIRDPYGRVWRSNNSKDLTELLEVATS